MCYVRACVSNREERVYTARRQREKEREEKYIIYGEIYTYIKRVHTREDRVVRLDKLALGAKRACA